MRLPQLTHLAIGSIYGRVRQIRPDGEIVGPVEDDIVDLTDTDVVDVDLVQGAPADPAGAPPR